MGQSERQLERAPAPPEAAHTQPECAPSPIGPRESGEEIDRFVSLVSHELRGPLATIAGYVQVLQREDGLPAAARRKANAAILDQIRNVIFIVDNLLQASRITGNRLRIERAETDLVEVVQKVVTERAGSQIHRIRLRLADTPIIGHWDRSLIGLALANLVSNAIKFSSQTEVSVELVKANDSAIVTVNDSGIGIAPGDLPELFRPYHRPKRTAQYPGIGVGLYVANGIIAAHGGQITVETSPGNTTFRATIPLG